MFCWIADAQEALADEAPDENEAALLVQVAREVARTEAGAHGGGVLDLLARVRGEDDLLSLERERDPARPGGHSIHVYDVFDGRLCKNGREFVEVSPGVPDGFRVDEHGNVWTSSHDSIQVFDPAGAPLLRIPVPEKIANLCFGGEDGRTLYITASTSLYRIRTTVRDAAALIRTP